MNTTEKFTKYKTSELYKVDFLWFTKQTWIVITAKLTRINLYLLF